MNNQGYINTNSFIHKLNPALKFIGFILMITLIFLPLGYLGQIIVGSMVMIGFILSKLSGRTLFNIFKSVLILFILLLLINWIVYKEPIAVSTGNSWNLKGQFNNLFLCIKDNNIYVSEIWGSQYQPRIFDIHDSQLINNIITINGADDTYAKMWLNNLKDDTKLQNELIQLFNGNEILAQKYYWIINQNTLKFDNSGISYNLLQISGTKIYDQKAFIYYNTEWYTFSPNAINLALYVSIKVFLMIVLATILTATTSSIELTNGLQTIFSPLRIFKLPVNEMSMMIAIALRFVPSLLIESKRILNAQASRGVDFNNGGMVTKLKALTSLVVPLFSIAFKNADDLGNAMEARGYNPRKARSKYRIMSIRYYDWISFSILGLTLGLFSGLLYSKIIVASFGILELGIVIG